MKPTSSETTRTGERTGVLLINLGTPDAPESGPVRRYLREFLTDPRVIDIGWLPRQLLVQAIIAPVRAPKSARAYRQVWDADGSPLLAHSRSLADGVAARLAPVPVALAMRYGSPSIADGVRELERAGCDEIAACPLYPQYATSSTGSSLAALYTAVQSAWDPARVRVLPPFFEAAPFLDAVAAVGRRELSAFGPDHVLFSYHGLPERHLTKSAPEGSRCLAAADCCATIDATNRRCYRAQCFATTRGLVQRLGLAEGGYSVAFQSRLGRTPWIRPFTDELLTELPARGVKRLAVFCPSFVADCLETLEEIAMRGAESFRAAGGEELRLVPCVNADAAWVAGLGAMIAELLGPSSGPSSGPSIGPEA